MEFKIQLNRISGWLVIYRKGILTRITQLKSSLDVLQSYPGFTTIIHLGIHDLTILYFVYAVFLINTDRDIHLCIGVVIGNTMFKCILQKGNKNQRSNPHVLCIAFNIKLDRDLIVKSETFKTDIVLHILNLARQ